MSLPRRLGVTTMRNLNLRNFWAVRRTKMLIYQVLKRKFLLQAAHMFKSFVPKLILKWWQGMESYSFVSRPGTFPYELYLEAFKKFS
jgi:hypothetical protein